MLNNSFKTIQKLALLVSTSLLLSCSNKEPVFRIQKSSNPWEDNYKDVSAMRDYKKWGTYNVHDPSVKKIGDTYYSYSTDAIYGEDSVAMKNDNLPFGYIQIRKSKDLVNWEFTGWAFPEIPEEAVKWVRLNSGGNGATNIWALTLFHITISTDYIIVFRLLAVRHLI